MNKKIIVESLAMDLKRVALGIHRGSFAMADRFKQEAFKRGEELNSFDKNEYLEKLLKQMKLRLVENNEKTAEDSLMLSTLFQNYAIKVLAKN